MFAWDAEGCDSTVNIWHPGNEADQMEPPYAFSSTKAEFLSDSSKKKKKKTLKTTRSHSEKPSEPVWNFHGYLSPLTN